MIKNAIEAMKNKNNRHTWVRFLSVVMPIIAIASIVVCVIFEILTSRQYIASQQLGPFVGAMVVIVVSWILILPLSNYVHEFGHKMIYSIAGTKSKIRIVAWNKLITEAVDKNGNIIDTAFREKLKNERPGLYYILCVSGVYFSTIVGTTLTILVLIVNQVTWYSGMVIALIFVYNILVIIDYIDNIRGTRKESDGCRARDVMNDM